MTLINPLLGSNLVSSGFDPELIENSVWLDGTTDFLSAELGAKTRTKAVIGTWIQKTGFTTSDATIFSKKGSAQFAIRMQDQGSNAGKISIFDYDGSNFQYSAESTSMLLRDNGWYHIMISIDTTASAGSRLKYYINGIDQTSTLTVTTDYTASDNPRITGGSGEPTQWGVGYSGTSQFNPCYLAQSFMLDDDSIQNGDVAVTDILDSFTFGKNGSQFGPKKNAAIATLASSAGGDSFCLDYANSILLGQDTSDNSEANVARSMTGLKSDDLDVGAASLLTDGTQFGSWNAGSNLVYQNTNTATKAWWGVDFGADGVAVTKAILYGNQSGDASTAGFTSTSISNVTFTLFGSDSAQATNNNDLSGLTTVGSVVVSNTQTKGVTATISATSNTTEFRYYYVQMDTTESTRRLLGEIELYTVGNSFLATSMSAANQSTNTPSLVYPKISNIGIPSGDTAANYTMGLGSNRMVYSGGNQAALGLIGTTLIQPDDPKIYWEFYVESGSVGGAGGGRLGNGIAVPHFNNGTGNGFYGAGGESAFFYLGTLYDNGVESVTGFTAAPVGGIQQMAFEPSTGKVWIGVDGTWRNGAGTSGTTLDESNPDDQLTVQDYVFIMGANRSSDIGVMNFGDNPTMSGNITAGGNTDGNGYGNFKYAVPSSFLAPNSANLTAPEAQGVDHFAVTLAQEGSLFSAMNTAEAAYSATLRIYKSRASASASETWGYSFSHDSSNEYILPAANTAMTYGSLRSLSGTDNWVGYSLDISSTAGTAAGSASHSNGSDTTVTHSLGSSRYIVLLFSRSGGDIFYYHPDVAAGSLLKFNSSVLPFSSTVITDITTNSFDIGSAAGSATYDYLVLAETPGVTDIFSYTGNNTGSNTDGPYIALNAMPEFWTAKLITTHATEHVVLDQTRSPINDSDIPYIMPNQLSAESNNTAFVTDFLSMAVKLRNASTDLNFNGGTFVGFSFGKIAGNGDLPPIYGR